MADGSWFHKGEVPPNIEIGSKGEMLRALSPLQALDRMQYEFARDPLRFAFTNGDVPHGYRQFRGACLLAWGAFYCQLPERRHYAEILLPPEQIPFEYWATVVPGARSEVAVYRILNEKNMFWHKAGPLCAAAIPYLIKKLAKLNPALT